MSKFQTHCSEIPSRMAKPLYLIQSSHNFRLIASVDVCCHLW